MTGPIPPELGQLTKLTSLDLSRNRLTGSIPPEIGQLTELGILSLWANRLTGNIPVELGRLTNLVILYLWANGLTGNIPLELGDIPRLWKLDLYDNQLTGRIPPELSFAENLRTLRLAGNSLAGCIPGALRDIADNDFAWLGLGYCAAVVHRQWRASQRSSGAWEGRRRDPCDPHHSRRSPAGQGVRRSGCGFGYWSLRRRRGQSDGDHSVRCDRNDPNGYHRRR